jgi:polyisoprenoid-binding protein YceI
MNILIRKIRWIVVPLLFLSVAGGAGAYWFVLRDTSAAKLALHADASVPAASNTDLSGEWTVVAGVGGEATTAGYRVQEKVAGGLVKTTATGRTGDVTGSVTVVGQRVTAAHFTVNMTTLKSDKSLRDTVLESSGIQTNTYPSAAFTLTDPITLPAIGTGEIYAVEARGTLTLHGVSNRVTVTLHYKPTKTGFVVLADMPIKMADYAIKAPSMAGIVSVDDHGSFELLASLAKRVA